VTAIGRITGHSWSSVTRLLAGAGERAARASGLTLSAAWARSLSSSFPLEIRTLI
jgi:hypothetical protein